MPVGPSSPPPSPGAVAPMLDASVPAEPVNSCARRYKGLHATLPRRGLNHAAETRMPLLQNLITDLAGIRVGHAQDPRVATGVTAIVFDTANVASAGAPGGGAGTRDTALLEPGAAVAGLGGVLG